MSSSTYRQIYLAGQKDKKKPGIFQRKYKKMDNIVPETIIPSWLQDIGETLNVLYIDTQSFIGLLLNHVTYIPHLLE